MGSIAKKRRETTSRKASGRKASGRKALNSVVVKINNIDTAELSRLGIDGKTMVAWVQDCITHRREMNALETPPESAGSTLNLDSDVDSPFWEAVKREWDSRNFPEEWEVTIQPRQDGQDAIQVDHYGNGWGGIVFRFKDVNDELLPVREVVNLIADVTRNEYPHRASVDFVAAAAGKGKRPTPKDIAAAASTDEEQWQADSIRKLRMKSYETTSGLIQDGLRQHFPPNHPIRKRVDALLPKEFNGDFVPPEPGAEAEVMRLADQLSAEDKTRLLNGWSPEVLSENVADHAYDEFHKCGIGVCLSIDGLFEDSPIGFLTLGPAESISSVTVFVRAGSSKLNVLDELERLWREIDRHWERLTTAPGKSELEWLRSGE